MRQTQADAARVADVLFPDPVPWMDQAACTQSGFDFVPEQESERGLKEARTWCASCPVRIQCLAWALQHGAEGYWGGTSTYQRGQLRRVRTRAKCPLCRSRRLVYADPHEMCLSCGISWVRDVREEPLAATPVPQPSA